MVKGLKDGVRFAHWLLLAVNFSIFLLAGALVAAPPASPQDTHAALAPVSEVYGTAADGTILHWTVYTPSTPGPLPAVLVIHGGGFTGGTPESSEESVSCAQDLAAAGYIAFSIEYRLAPPGKLAGQKSDGRYPQQNDDVKLAVRAARNDLRCNGQVGAVGGSAGGYHSAYAAVTGTPGDDRIDVGVSLSGLYDLSDFSPNPNLSSFTNTLLNFVNLTTSDTAALRAASPAWLADASASPLLLVNTLEDPMPYVQIADFVTHLDALGLKNYQAVSLTGAAHSFANWPAVKTTALAFLTAHFTGQPWPPPLPSPAPADLANKLLNLSARSHVGTVDKVMVGGFIVTGNTDKRVILRGIGPSLSQVGVTGALSNPKLTLYDSAGTLMESNDDRLALAGVANPLLPASPAEAYLTAILPPGGYTAVLEATNSTTGTGLLEIYDVQPGSSRLANISARCDIATTGDVIIGGFIIGGADATQVIARALGPSLGAFGVSGPLPNPVLDIFDANGSLLVSNDNWRSTQEAQIAGTIPPGNDLEAAIVATLPPGNYTAVARDATGTPGIGLVEVYNLEP